MKALRRKIIFNWNGAPLKSVSAPIWSPGHDHGDIWSNMPYQSMEWDYLCALAWEPQDDNGNPGEPGFEIPDWIL